MRFNFSEKERGLYTEKQQKNAFFQKPCF